MRNTRGFILAPFLGAVLSCSSGDWNALAQDQCDPWIGPGAREHPPMVPRGSNRIAQSTSCAEGPGTLLRGISGRRAGVDWLPPCMLPEVLLGSAYAWPEHCLTVDH